MSATRRPGMRTSSGVESVGLGGLGGLGGAGGAGGAGGGVGLGE